MLVYVFVKLAVEGFWCWFGASRPDGAPSGSRVALALRATAVRLLAARVLSLLVEALGESAPQSVIYFAMLLPLRWILWGMAGQLIVMGRVGLLPLLASDRRSNLWRAGGLLVSSAADLAGFLEGLWVGRLWP